jgi:hypothetical protein
VPILETDLPRVIDEMRSRQQIADLCHLYCRALDRVDEALLRSVFHPDSTHHHDLFQGPSAEFCGYAIELLKTLDRTQHLLGNILIEFSGDVATAESYFLAYHRVAAGTRGPGMFANHDLSIAEDVYVGGRYVDRFERRDGIWKIAHRTGIHEWETWQAASDRHFPVMEDGGKGHRDGTDIVYRIAAAARAPRRNGS